MFNALKAQGVPTAYIAFPGEGHGFRQAETIKRTLEAEFYFYSRLFGFTPSDDLQPVHIENTWTAGTTCKQSNQSTNSWPYVPPSILKWHATSD